MGTVAKLKSHHQQDAEACLKAALEKNMDEVVIVGRQGDYFHYWSSMTMSRITMLGMLDVARQSVWDAGKED